MVLTFVFLFKTLLDILLHAGGEEVKTSSDIAATAERKSLKQDRKWQKRKRIFTVKEEGWSRGFVTSFFHSSVLWLQIAAHILIFQFSPLLPLL